MRGDQLTRGLQMLTIFATHRRGVPVEELRALLGCSRSTLYRDLRALQAAHFPLISEADPDSGQGGTSSWRLLGEGLQLGVFIELNQYIALHIASAHLRAAGAAGALLPQLEQALEKLRSSLPANYEGRFEALIEKVELSSRGAHDYASRDTLLGSVYEALNQQCPLHITYATPGTPKPRSRVIHPFGMYLHKGGIYLVGWDSRSDDQRTFLVDRIRLASLGSGRFEIPEGFDLKQYFEDAFGVFVGKEKISLRFSLNQKVAHLLEERRFHPTQQVRKTRSGVQVSMRVTDSPELRSFLRSFGPALLVLEPPTLAKALAEDARATLARYTQLASKQKAKPKQAHPKTSKAPPARNPSPKSK